MTNIHQVVVPDPSNLEPSKVQVDVVVSEKAVAIVDIGDESHNHVELHEAGSGSRILKLFGWDRFDPNRLVAAERALLGSVKTSLESRHVPVRFCCSHIYTVTASTPATCSSTDREPFVLIHGLGAGSALWSANVDALASLRPTHAFDLPGFGRSSRPRFNEDATIAELEFVQAIDDWREAMNIDRMVLVGHSFGGYLAAAYALQHPENVRHLVLVDPWGFAECPENPERQKKLPLWVRTAGKVASYFNPLSGLRVAGPYGVSLIRSLRPDLGMRYKSDNEPDAVYEYIYHINARRPTGELAFKSMTKTYGWAKRPMVCRLDNLHHKVPVTFIYGSRSWIDNASGFVVQRRRPGSYVDVHTVPNAGHHVYADAHAEFNALLQKVSNAIDAKKDVPRFSSEVD